MDIFVNGFERFLDDGVDDGSLKVSEKVVFELQQRRKIRNHKRVERISETYTLHINNVYTYVTNTIIQYQKYRFNFVVERNKCRPKCITRLQR